MTAWDIRSLLRALGAATLGLVVVWLVTAASDEGQLTIGARAGRTLPLAPLCSAVGAVLALGTARVRQEALAFEALGRSPAETGRAAAVGAAIPSLLVALAIGSVPAIDVGAFFPRAATGETFLVADGSFVSPTLGVRVDAAGDAQALDPAEIVPDDASLPRGARLAAALATGLAGLALALVAARVTLRRSLVDERARRRLRVVAAGEAVACAVTMIVAFQLAATKLAPALLAAAPPALLLGGALLRRRRAEAA